LGNRDNEEENSQTLFKATSFLHPYLHFVWASERSEHKDEHSVCIFSEKDFVRLIS